MLAHPVTLNTLYFCYQPLHLLRGGLQLVLVTLAVGLKLAEIAFKREVFFFEFGQSGRFALKKPFQRDIFLPKLFVIADNGIDFIFKIGKKFD